MGCNKSKPKTSQQAGSEKKDSATKSEAADVEGGENANREGNAVSSDKDTE